MREGSECKGAAAARNTRTFLSAGENVRERERERGSGGRRGIRMHRGPPVNTTRMGTRCAYIYIRTYIHAPIEREYHSERIKESRTHARKHTHARTYAHARTCTRGTHTHTHVSAYDWNHVINSFKPGAVACTVAGAAGVSMAPAPVPASDHASESC